MAVVAEFGPGVGMDDIAKASGIAKPVFYRYFNDKSDLFLAVGRTVAEGVVADVTSAINNATTPRSKLAAGIDAYLANIEERPELYRFVVQHSDASTLRSDGLVGDYATIVGLHATQVIGEFMRLAGLDSGAAELWGFGIVGLVRAAADRWLDQPAMSRSTVASYLTDLVWLGLSQRERTAPE